MASRLIDLISKKTNCTCSTLFWSFPCRCFARLQRCFVRLKRQTSQLHIIFMEELLYELTQYFVSCVHVCFYFSLPLIFTLLAVSSSRFLTTTLNFHVFPPTKFVSFVLNNSLQLFLCYPRWCKQKTTQKKTRLCCCCCFFLKVRVAMRFPSK